MDQQRIARRSIAPLPFLLSLLPLFLTLSASPAWSGTYKCRGADGQISYQQTPCPPESDGDALAPDIATPSGTPARGADKKYTVEAQLKALEKERRRAGKERAKPQSVTRTATKDTPGADRARCAKHRAEVAKWRREVRNGYMDRDQQEQEAQMLKHHEALVDRYCEPEP